MVFKKTVVIFIAVSYVLGTCAMEHDIKKENPDPVVITGELFRYPWNVYRGNHKKNLPAGYSSEKINDEEDTWFSVWATSKDSNNWHWHGHPALNEHFPMELPLKLFLKPDQTLKTDGDTVELSFVDKKTQIASRIVLTLKQIGHRGDRWGEFDKCLKASKDYEKLIKPYIKEAPAQ